MVTKEVIKTDTQPEIVEKEYREKPHRERGILKWFDVNKNYGFILTRDKKDLFVHRRNLVNYKNNIFLEGDEVEFELFKTETGIQARKVKKVRNYGKRLLGDIGTTYLKKLIPGKIKVTCLLTKNKKITGLIKKVKPYEIVLDVEGADGVAIPKLEILYLHKEHYSERLVGLITTNEEMHSKNQEISQKVTERYQINNDILKEAFNKNATVKLTLIDGTTISGAINWFTKYELLFWVHPKANLFIMRHAISDFVIEKIPETIPEVKPPKREVTQITKRSIKNNKPQTIIRRRIVPNKTM